MTPAAEPNFERTLINDLAAGYAYKDRLILSDVDETVLHFAEPFQRYCEAHGYATYGRLRDMYDLETFLNLSRIECEMILRDFSLTSEGGDVQPAEDCAASVVPMLHVRHGYQFLAITACGTDPVFAKRRAGNLLYRFGFSWLDVRTVGLGATKADVLREFPNAVWVEDHFGHAVAGAEMGHRTFLLTRAYNEGRSHPLVTRVADWHEIAAHLEAE